MVVGAGSAVPEGSLPVFSVDTLAEARSLITLTCPTDEAGTYYARELATDQTLENLRSFSDRVEKGHELLRMNGHCRCAGRES